MSLNWQEINLVLQELDLTHCILRDARQPDFHQLIFTFYRTDTRDDAEGESSHDPLTAKNFHVLICLKSGFCRVHLVAARPRTPLPRQRFEQFLRAHLCNRRVLEVTQMGTERIIQMKIGVPEKFLVVWIRLWSGAGNVFVTNQENTILEVCFRRPKRNEAAGKEFILPVPRPAPSPTADEEEHTHKFRVREHPADRSFNDWIGEEYQNLEQEKIVTHWRTSICRALDKDIAHFRTKLEHLTRKQAQGESPAIWNRYGQLILAYANTIHTGDRTAHLEGMTIKLMPDKTAIQNAQRYFDKAKQQRHRNDDLLIEQCTQQLKERESARARMEQPTLSHAELNALLKKYPQRNTHRMRAQHDRSQGVPPKKIPGKQFESHNFQIVVGLTARDNDQILRRHVKGNDIWLHVRDWPGAHVYIKVKKNKSVPLDTLLDAANLALFHSKIRGGLNHDVHYTPVKYLRRVRDGKPGQVIPTHEKNIMVRFDKERVARLQLTR